LSYSFLAGSLAHGAYLDSAHTKSNFGKLRISTSAQATDLQQMRAAGWLEGYLTAGGSCQQQACKRLLATAALPPSPTLDGGNALQPPTAAAIAQQIVVLPVWATTPCNGSCNASSSLSP
jgi:hypothetical protein